MEDDRVRQLINGILAMAYLSDHFSPETAVSISDAELERRYENDSSRYHRPETVSFAQILTEDRATADSALAELKTRVAEHAPIRRLFRQLSKKYSKKPAAGSRGNYIVAAVSRTDNQVPRSVRDAAFAMHNINQFSSVIKSENGYHILFLTDRRPAEHKSLEEATPELREIITREKLDDKRREFIDGLVDLEQWEISHSQLQKVVFAAPGSARGSMKSRTNATTNIPGNVQVHTVGKGK